MEQFYVGRRLRSPSEKLKRKAALDALGQAIRDYWEHLKALPVPDHLRA
jgi:hypothetical protein